MAWRAGPWRGAPRYSHRVVRALSVVLALAAACGGGGPGRAREGARGEAVPTSRPRLVVLIVIDQWPSWMFERERARFTGGLGRLVREGAIVPAAEIEHANTYTAPGHATIGTGAWPRDHGVVGNYWYRRAEGRERPAEYDPDAMPLVVGPPIGPEPLSTEDGASGRVLRVDGIADALRAGTSGAGRSVTIALKSRSACLIAGRAPDLAVWFEPGAGGMTTSRAYAAEAPSWLRALAASTPASRQLGATWTPLDPARLRQITGLADDAAGEGANHGLGATFPHALAASDRPDRTLQMTPFADELVAQAAVAALDAMPLGRDDVPDLLALSFGAHDYAGHAWGPDSWEVVDVMLRLDRTLGELFATLDARLGAQGWAAIVTSDHGATPVVERSHYPGARRIPPAEIEAAAEQAIAAQAGGPGPWVARLVSSNLYATPRLAGLPEGVRQRALDAAATAVAAVPGVAAVGRTDLLGEDCARQPPSLAAICAARVVGQAGELYVYPRAGAVISPETFGTGHDAPVDDNRRVPILVRAAGLSPRVGAGSQRQVAPTLAALLGVAPPSHATAPPLFGIRAR